MAPEPVGNPFENLIRLMLLIFFIFSTYFTIGGRSDMPTAPPLMEEPAANYLLAAKY